MSQFPRNPRVGYPLSGTLLAFAVALGLPCASAAAEETSARNDVLEEIIVTARKRNESLQEIPESVSAISGDELEAGGITHINDIGLRITNLNLSARADGNPNVTIRGVGSFGNTQGVGFYVDGHRSLSMHRRTSVTWSASRC